MVTLHMITGRIIASILVFALVLNLALAETEFETTKQLAEAENAPAQVKLGLMYTNGEGVPENYAEAVKWYRKAALQGYPNGQYILGSMYYKGQGVTLDFVQAYNWWNLAAAQGFNKARESRKILRDSMIQSQITKAQKISNKFEPLKSPNAGF